ncbi:hypothetical protein EMGBS8_14410 [Verrucomicrobiota bacterium]|jgi:hypothetical protein|nr:hypothetical protein EMGBS8_14410 [Verrucomicrobiota bacterium]
MSSVQPPEGENVISLQNISRNFLSMLQRQHDMLAYSLAGLRTADPKAYDYYSTVSRVMPAPQVHLPHDQMLAYARNLMLRTSINDLIGLSAECMNHCHLLCTLIRVRGKQQQVSPDLDKQIAQKHEAFCRLNLQEKFNELEATFDIICDLEDGIFSLAAALRVLVRGGMVTNDDITPDGSLTLEFKAMKDVEVPNDSPEDLPENTPVERPLGLTGTPQVNLTGGLNKATKTISKLSDTQRTFRPGEMLDLTDEEVLGLNITVAKFFDGLFRSVEHYGRSSLGDPS